MYLPFMKEVVLRHFLLVSALRHIRNQQCLSSGQLAGKQPLPQIHKLLIHWPPRFSVLLCVKRGLSVFRIQRPSVADLRGYIHRFSQATCHAPLGPWQTPSLSQRTHTSSFISRGRVVSGTAITSSHSDDCGPGPGPGWPETSRPKENSGVRTELPVGGHLLRADYQALLLTVFPGKVREERGDGYRRWNRSLGVRGEEGGCCGGRSHGNSCEHVRNRGEAARCRPCRKGTGDRMCAHIRNFSYKPRSPRVGLGWTIKVPAIVPRWPREWNVSGCFSALLVSAPLHRNRLGSYPSAWHPTHQDPVARSSPGEPWREVILQRS